METPGSTRSRKSAAKTAEGAVNGSASKTRKAGPRSASRGRKPKAELKFKVDDAVKTVPASEVKAATKKKPEKSPRRNQSKSPARNAAQTPATRASARLSGKEAVSPVQPLQPQAPKRSFLWVSTLICILASPVVLIVLHSSCTKATCKITWPLYKPPRNPLAFWDPEALALVLACEIGLLLLSMLPIGKKMSSPSGHTVFINGALFLLAGVFGPLGLYFKGLDVSLVNKKYFRIMTSGLLVTFIISLFGYVLARLRGSGNNPKGNTGNWVTDFFHGKEMDPVFLRVDLKLLVHRLSLTGMALLNVFLLLGSIGKNETYNQGAAVVVFLQTLYAFDGLLFEGNFFNTYTALNNGFGYSFVSMKIFFPFMTTLITRYIINRSPIVPNTIQGVSVALFLVGLFLYRRSEIQAGDTNHKYKRINSAGGAWNLIRYPNYLGQLLMFWSWVLPAAYIAGSVDLLIYFVPLILTVCTVLKIRKENVRNASRHGNDWNTYSKRVTANLIPKIF